MWINRKKKLSGLHNRMLSHVTSIPDSGQLEMKNLEIVLIRREIARQKEGWLLYAQLFL